MTPLLAAVAGLTALVWLVPVTLQPARFGLSVIAVGTILQTVALVTIAVPLLGSSVRWAPIWKECFIAILLILLIASGARSRRLAPSMIIVVMAIYSSQVILMLLFPELLTPGSVDDNQPVARLAGARQWLVPAYLIFLGAVVSRSDCPPTRILQLVRVYGTSVAAIAIIDWLLVPTEFWASANVLTTGQESIGIVDEQIDGMHSHFFGWALPRAVAPFGSPLALAFALTLPLITTAAEPRSSGRTLRLVLMGFALALTQTRSIMLALLMLWVFTQLSRRRLDRLIFGASLVMGLLTIDTLRSAVSNTLTLSDPSARAHVEQVVFGWNQLLSNPWGYGLGQGGRHGRVLGDGLAGGENLFLVAGNERGWAGLLLLCALLAILYTYLNGPADLRIETLQAACRYALLAFLAASLTTEHAIAFNSSWLLWVAIGYCVGFGKAAVGHPIDSAISSARAAPSGITGARRLGGRIEEPGYGS